MHLRFADLNDPSCAECIKLAEHASHAVDFQKTGTPVKFQDIPRLKNQPKPDFLSHEGRELASGKFYNSPKLLGQLFRRVPLKEWMPKAWYRPGPPSQGEIVENALHGVRLYDIGLPELLQPSDELCDEMQHLLEEYCEQLKSIGQAHTLSKSKDIFVSEAELVSGTLMANWPDHHRRREAVNAMNMQASAKLSPISSISDRAHRPMTLSVLFELKYKQEMILSSMKTTIFGMIAFTMTKRTFTERIG